MAMSKNKCVICGKTVYWEGRAKKACSDECRATLNKRIDEENRRKLLSVTKVCEYCGKEFHPTTHRQSYCTPECGYKARREKTKENRKIRRMKKKKKGKSVLTDAKLEEIHKSGKTYAQYQMEETIKLYGKVNLW